MLAITPKTKIVDIINEDYTVMSILLRLDILPGYGEKTVSQIAEENNFDLDFFVNILAAYTDPEFSNYEKLINIEVRHITDFLKKSHDFYKDEKIPELKKLFSKIIEQAVVKNNIKIIEHYFNSYLDEFYVHMEYEEKQVFPYAEELDTILKTGKASDTFLEGFKNFPYGNM
jgi:regulator of cell morphogenesis and NO signaling